MTKTMEMFKAADRLRQLEKLERYREERLAREINIYEESRRKEDEEVKRQRDAEVKRRQYFDKQKDQLGTVQVKRNEEMQKKA